MAAALVGGISSAQATPESEDAKAIGNAIESFADRLGSASDALGEYGDLADNLPLTDLAPGDPGGLNLSDLLDEAVGPLGSYASMGALATAIEARDDTYGGITVQFGAGSFTQPAVMSTANSITIPIHATRTVSQPLDFSFSDDGSFGMKGGSLGVDFVLDTTLAFTADSAQIVDADTAPPTAVSLAPPTIELCAHATGSVDLFTARFGFTDVNISTDNPATSGTTEAATLHACADVVFQDPDSVGGITLDEWTSHALSELATANVVKGNPSGNDLAATFYVDATLVNGDAFTDETAADASITFTDADLSNGFDATPVPTLGALGDWENISVGDVANGLAQFVSSLAAAQGKGDAPLPLVGKSLTEIFDGVQPLLDYTDQLMNATVGCGTTPGDSTHFPTGFTDNLTVGTKVYCRGETQEAVAAGTVMWTSDVATVMTNGTSDATLAQDPTADAVFEMTSAGNFSAIVAWTSGGESKTAIPRPGSAQELFALLASAAGLDDDLANLGYDAATKSLTFHLALDTPLDPAAASVDANIGDLLRNSTNLAGLKEATGSLQADVDDVDFDVTFGVLLNASTSDITPIRGTATGGSSAAVLEDNGANFTDGVNDPKLGQVLKKTSVNPAQQCTISAVSATTLTCAAGSGISWSLGDSYDVDGGLIDRFFVQVDPSGPELSVGDVSLDGNATLTGKVGFVEIEAGGDAAKNSFSTSVPKKAFEIARADDTKPALAIEIETPNPFSVVTGGSTTTIPDAVGVGELLSNLDAAHVSAVCNLTANAGLGIAAKVANGTKTLGSGSVAVNWETVFEADSCTPDFSTLEVDADTDFDTSLRDFDPFPSVTGKHTGATADDLFDGTKDFTKVGFVPGADASPEGGNNLLQLTLQNKTTGASCTIATVTAQELECTLSGGTRADDTANANKWKTGDEYGVEGNALAWLGYILDNLDKIVEQVDQLDPGLTDKQLPLVGISTKDIVGKIKSIKQTTDELRGAPLAQLDCTGNADGTNPTTDANGNPFDLTQLPRGQKVYCRAITTVVPTEVEWTVLKNPSAPNNVTIGANADSLDTVGASPSARVEVEIGDSTQIPVSGPRPLIAISDWQIKVEFTDAAGNHNTEFPTSSPPQSLQELEELIGEKLGVPGVLKLDLLDLPAAGQAPRTTGTATADSTADNVLEDEGETFPANAEASRPFIGNLLINTTDKTQCTITAISDETLTCAPGAGMQWSDGDGYEVVGNNTKDLVVRLGIGFCSGGEITCKPTDRSVPALEAPLNVQDDFANIVAVESEGTIALDYAARAQLDLGIPIKLALVPDVVVLDTSGASLEANLNADGVGLEAAIGPVSVKLGSKVSGGVGIGKLGAKLGLESNDDDVANNKTRTFGDFLTAVAGNASFEGTDQECDAPEGDPVEASGHACAVLTVEALGTNFGEFTIECTIGADPLCDAELPAALKTLIEGAELDWTLLVQVVQQILTKLETTLDGAAQDIKLPLIGNALDAGANVVGAFNDNVVTPFNDLVQDIKAAADQDADTDVDAYDAAKLAQTFIFDGLGPASTPKLLQDTNGDGTVTKEDVVVTPLCGVPAVPCANGAGLGTIRDFRITFSIGQGIDGDVPFDVGLKGLPLRLTGGVHGDGSWSLLVDVGLSFDGGPYIVANGKKGFTGTENRPFDVDTDDPPDGTDDAHSAVTYLQDDGTNFTNVAELGMWLKKTSGSGAGSGCRVTKIETNKLYCDDYGTDTVGPLTWGGTDGYELIARHAPDTPDAGGASELRLKGLVTMAEVADACDAGSAGLPDYLGDNFTNTRCLEGQIAFLKVNVRDRNGTLDENAECDTLFTPTGEEPTALCLTAALDFKKTGASKVTLSDLVSGNFSLAPRLNGAANIDVRLRTGLNIGQSAGFPSVLGKFHLFWGFSVAPGSGVDYGGASPLAVSFDGLNLDAGKFISEFLGPIIKQVKDVTNPLMPVVEMIQGEVPIISDLSKLVGQGPVTVLDLLEAISGNDLSLLRSILQMIKFVNSLPTNGNLLIPLGSGTGGGSFAVTTSRATNSQPLPQDAGEGITGADGGKNLIDKLGAGGSPYAAAKTTPAQCDRGATFGVCGLTFPFFGDASQIFGVLMGKDATLVHYDAGSFGAGAGFGFCFPPIIIGPVPVQICIGGSFRVEGRFAMGYDTSGLRKVLAGGTGTHLLDGIFLDDYDSNGVDVPEVKFTGRVYAEGAVSVYIFKVGIRGEIIFTTGLNLHEDPPQDGKLRIEEIIAKIYNPICLFDVEGKIEAALSAFVKIDLFITSIEFSIEIVRITLLEFNLSVCNVKPVLAKVVTAGDVENLRLNMGSSALRNERGIAAGEINEKFTVRQMESAGGKTRFSVSAFGIQQDYFLTTSKVGTDKAWLIANADDGDDVVTLLPGSAQGEQAQPTQQKPSIPFTLWADISAGTGNDEITTGDGNDIVDGDPGDDVISTGGGVDEIRGGTDNDRIDAGAGNDTNVHGNGGNDIINGGPGADKLFGDAGDDVISAGPGDNGTSVDEMTGGAGNDTLNADGGGDKLWGDEDTLSFACTADSGNDGSTLGGLGGRDTLIGAAGNDLMHGGNGDDTLDGADGDDTMCGGGGNDEMKGGAGADAMSGNGGDDNMVGSTDGGSGDTMNGNGGRDYMLGDDGTLTRDGSNNVTANVAGGTAGGTDTMNGGPGRDFMWGQGGADTMNGNAGNDEMHGGAANDVMHGNDDDDEMYGDDGDDEMYGDAGNDYMRGGIGTDTMDGDAGNDEMYGDNNRDVMSGGANDDLVRGGGGDDSIEGNGNDSSALPLDDAVNPLANVNFDLHLEKQSDGSWTKVGGNDGDVIYGDAGQDDIIGGSSSTAADGGDTILGNVEQDVILGDNGTIARPGGTGPDGTVNRTVSLLDPGGAVAGNSGDDWIQGNLGNDDIYAGGGSDLVHGDEGDDSIEGNGGSDGAGVLGGPPVAAIGLYGDSGQDDIIGGTSQGSGGAADGGDDIWGGQGEDVIAGDNATITRTGGGTCNGFVCNTFRDGDVVNVVIRRIQLWDVATTTSTPAAGTSGNDTVDGQDGHDRIYGQGGGDNLKGGLNDDFVFGNAGADTIFGGDGQDDLVGGTGRTDSATAASAIEGRLDEGDVIYGEADFDAIAGDNSRMVRRTGGVDDDHGLWVANTFNAAVDRLIALMDVGVVGTPAGAGTSGNDQLLGGDADDVIYGQGGNDGISGGEGQDIIEGNANGTGNAPDPGGTYGDAWPPFEGDVIHGDAGADDIAGGTGWIYRMVGGAETGDPIVGDIRVGTDGRLDGNDTIFGDGGGDAIAGDNTVIERALTGAGAWVLDDLHSPDALGVVRRIMRERDVATTTNLGPLTNGTSGDDDIFGNDGVDVAYGQGGDDEIQGNAGDDHLEGSEGDDTIAGGEGRDDVIGGTGRTFSNDETTAVAGRIDNPVGDDAPNDVLHGGDGLGGVASGDDDVIIGDNGTVDRVRGTLGTAGAELNRLPFNGTWGEATWDEPNILRVIRLLDVSKTGATAPETNGTNGDDTINGEANEDVIFGQGGNDTITGDDAELSVASPADASPGDDYIEGNGGIDTIRGDLGQDDITGGGSAVQDGTPDSALDGNRDGTLDPGRLGETLRDAGDLIAGDSGDANVGSGDVIAGDNARIQRPLAAGTGDWRTDANRGAILRDVQLFDLEKVDGAEGKSADPGESGVDSIFGNGGPDIAFGQGNGTAPVPFGAEGGSAGPNCQNMGANGPGSGPAFSPVGDDDNDGLPDLSDPDCRAALVPGDKLEGQAGGDYLEGNQGSDYITGGDGEDDIIGGSSSNDGHIAAIRAKDERPAGALPTGFAPAPPSNLLDGHDQLQGNGDDDTIVGDNAFIDRYLSGASGTWITIVGPGRLADPDEDFKHPEEAAYGPYPGQIRRDVTMQQTPESDGAYGDDLIKGGTENDDLYGQRGNDWIEGNEGEDAIVGDLGKILDNLLGGPGVGDEVPDPPLDQYIRPNAPFLDDNINRSGVLKREVTLYSFDITEPNPAIGHDTALGGPGNDWIHTGPGEDLANGNSGDDRIFLGDSKAGAIVKLDPKKIAHDFVDAGWGGQGHDHIYGGYGADFLDVRPRTAQAAPGIVPGADPATWFQVAGMVTANPGQTDDVYGDFSGIDFIYGGWDQDAMQANRGDNGPTAGDRLMDWSGSYNIYYLCPATYGDFVTTRQIAPGLIEFLQNLSFGDGSLNPATPGTSGFRDTAIVFSKEAKFNANPVHPDTPGHFNTACDP